MDRHQIAITVIDQVHSHLDPTPDTSASFTVIQVELKNQLGLVHVIPLELPIDSIQSQSTSPQSRLNSALTSSKVTEPMALIFS
jgi:hypothetical protein